MVCILSATDEKSKIQIRKPVVRIRGSGSVPKCHGSTARGKGDRNMSHTTPSNEDPDIFHPGSRILTVSIPDPGSASKNLDIFNPKTWFLSFRKYDPGCSSRIPDPDPDILPIPDPRVKKTQDPGSGTLTKLFRSIIFEGFVSEISVSNLIQIRTRKKFVKRTFSSGQKSS
jgi:hypothetical protein